MIHSTRRKKRSSEEELDQPSYKQSGEKGEKGFILKEENVLKERFESWMKNQIHSYNLVKN